MRVLTAEQMREVDRRTIELGIPGLVLMENAAMRVVEFLERRYAPLKKHRVVIYCGKGNNGGDGMAIARQLKVRDLVEWSLVVLAADPEELRGDAADQYRMLRLTGPSVHRELPEEGRQATLVIDALLGTGVKGAATGRVAECIGEINERFPHAQKVAVDIPTGLPSDEAGAPGPFVRADATVTFTAPKPAHVLPPNCDRMGELIVGAIGSPARLFDDKADNGTPPLILMQAQHFRSLVAPRRLNANKGTYGHVAIIAGARGKTGAAAMCGMAGLRAGAGLVTVATAESALPAVAAYAPEYMTVALPETAHGSIAYEALSGGAIEKLLDKKSVLALGPGIGSEDETVRLVRELAKQAELPMVIDADGLNALVGTDFSGKGKLRVMTPHPGEMGRLAGMETGDVQRDRLGVARQFARERSVILVLKGQRTVIAFPDGRAWINPTGTPAMATGGTGDILTGLIAGLLAQFPQIPEVAVGAAVYLHGLAGERGAVVLGEQALVATDLLRYLPEAMRDVSNAVR